MKYCSHCGAELLDEAVICPKCGCPVETVPAKTEVNAGQRDARGLGIASIVLGCFPFVPGLGSVLSIIGIILGAVGLHKSGTALHERHLNIAGLVVSCVTAFLSIIFVVIYIILITTPSGS